MNEPRIFFMNLGDVHRQMEQFLSHVNRSAGAGSKFSACLWEPPVDVYETEDDLVVLCELPGVERDRVEIVVDGQTLTIRGERRRSESGPSRRYHRMEVCFGEFVRTVDLPGRVEPASAQAAYRDGFMQVTFRKVRPESTSRVIVVTEG